jgi:hypothetical protein
MLKRFENKLSCNWGVKVLYFKIIKLHGWTTISNKTPIIVGYFLWTLPVSSG